MTLGNPESPLLVKEVGGTGRSGKNTLVKALEAKYPFVATEETGADYRLAAWALLDMGEIELGMDPDLIVSRVQAVGYDALVDVVAQRNAFIEEHGHDKLHAPEIDDTVHSVGKSEVLRGAVKASFQRRVEAVRDSGNFSVLVVDGRNLAPVVAGIAGTRLIMRTFVCCGLLEATRRECERKGVRLNSDEGHVIMQSIQKRNQVDVERPLDPVVPDRDAIDYWNSGITQIEEASGLQPVVRGVGTMAVQSGRQVLFNTTYFRRFADPRGSMVSAATQMFEEALEAAAVKL